VSEQFLNGTSAKSKNKAMIANVKTNNPTQDGRNCFLW